MALGSPAIPDPRALELRPIQAAIAAARQRIEALERSLASTAALAGQTAYTGGSGNSAAVTALQNSVTALATTVAAIQDITDALTAVSGLVAMVGGVPTGRTLVEGSNVTITNPDGVGGDPVISVDVPSADSILYDGQGRALLTHSGHALLVT